MKASGLILGCIAGTGILLAQDPSPRLRAAILAGIPDYHGNPFPEVVDPPPPPPPEPEVDPDVVQLAPVTVDTTKLPTEGYLKTPKTRNIIERYIPGTGVTVNDTKYGRRTVGRVLFIPVFFNLNW